MPLAYSELLATRLSTEERMRLLDHFVEWRGEFGDRASRFACARLLSNWLLSHGRTALTIMDYEGNNQFMHDMKSELRLTCRLTANQYSAVLRIIQSGELENEVAYSTQAPNILNGYYKIVVTAEEVEETFHYKIHTVSRGPLAGQRIIKVKNANGVYKGFAFLTTNGGMRVWQRFVEDVESGNLLYPAFGAVLKKLRDGLSGYALLLVNSNGEFGFPSADLYISVVEFNPCTVTGNNRNITNDEALNLLRDHYRRSSAAERFGIDLERPFSRAPLIGAAEPENRPAPLARSEINPEEIQ